MNPPEKSKAELPVIKPTHKAVKKYYEMLQGYGDQQVDHEGAVSSAFQRLLEDTGKTFGWTFLGKLGETVVEGRIIPDGTLRDNFRLERGYWEAKDTHDDLDGEIRKKLAKGYPLSNIIFEDTRQAVLIQNGREILRVDLSDAQKLADLLNSFYRHTEPPIEKFEKAVDEFKVRVPELAGALNRIIKDAHQNNKSFITAFADFYKLCQDSLNPNLSRDAVDEMVIQHLLTERLIRTIFDNADFIRRNVIAVEVEKVINALTSKSFNRDDFLRRLDPFYIAIEEAARKIEDFQEKQHFLNTVYERFFQGYSVKVADTHGIVYTPQEIVDFMCASVVEVLKTEFGKELSDPWVQIIDPATGTGSFIVNLLRRIPKPDLQRVYRQQLFANEVMLLPYYIASLNIEHADSERQGEYEVFPGLCFVDTLELVSGKYGAKNGDLYISEANTDRINAERKALITVIIGNPPYNVGQQNENDNNKNRKYETIDRRVKDTYSKDSTATNKNALSDAYVKFYRWATDRLKERDGIVCFVSNNSFIDDIAFDGMRKNLASDYDKIFVLDLKGNVRKDSMREGFPIGEKHTVFGLSAMVGISVTILIRSSSRKKSISHYAVDWKSTRMEKFDFIQHAKSISNIFWNKISPDKRQAWLKLKNVKEFASFIPISTQKAKSTKSLSSSTIFRIYSRGVVTCRDGVVYDFSRDSLVRRVKEFADDYNSEIDRYKRLPLKEREKFEKDGTSLDNFVRYDRIKWSRDLKQDLIRGRDAHFEEAKIRNSIYRPFSKKWLFFDRILNEEVYVFPQIFPIPNSEQENRVVCLSGIAAEKPFYSIITNIIPNLSFTGFGSGCQCFPFYFYNEDGSNHRDNITDWAMVEFRKHYNDPKISKWDIFYYVYGLLHHPKYREDFADNLKRDLPHVPLTPDFRSFTEAGRKLADLHLNYEQIEPYPLQKVCAEKKPLSYLVQDKMRLSKDKTEVKINDSLTLRGIPPETFDYRLGNRSALDWIIDQYQVKRDEKDQIRSDPNRQDDLEYIVRLVGQVIKVSLETVNIVNSLPKEYS